MPNKCLFCPHEINLSTERRAEVKTPDPTAKYGVETKYICSECLNEMIQLLKSKYPDLKEIKDDHT